MPGRGNGLDAESYKPLTDLDPEYADDMLDTLRSEGVAAYVTPLDHEPGLLRLWVDAAATSRARTLLRTRREAWAEAADDDEAGEAGETSEREGAEAKASTVADGDAAGPATGTAAGTAAPDEDELWAQIVAGFDTEVADPVPRWPVAEDIDPGGPAPTGGRKGGNVTRPGDGSFRIGVVTPGPRDWSPAEGSPNKDEPEEPDELDEDPDEHFVPPPPPPLPKTDVATKLAWVALLGGPLFLLGAVLLGRPIGEWTTFAAIAACGGGFIALVSRLRRDQDEDDPDDGAVV
ncbi:hypothetical protein LO772_24325 [Yinghuangia sp. ASG 101]|uniref:hypothetical protein n=1 Tax=Yinghuangia sp. ASG 101 TaxID=2896848 RepID=UPI001E4DA44E|nr:hypothetical protein [Yinghuangia sp. ASG 101]UGQ09999.1 hypothetical protein LO772_24325 [Yinghuangia sp. ASG 101]